KGGWAEQIIAGCYGLVDAPLHWRRSLTEDMKALGYEQSALDPCVMKLYNKAHTKLLGAIAIEVDDLFTVGHAEHHHKMELLRKRYTFGKYVHLQKEKDGPSSLMVSKLSKMTVEGIVQMNQVVLELKDKADLCLQIQPLKRMRLSVVTDALFANSGFHSQGGHLVLAHESQLRDGHSMPTNIVAWRSGKLQRVVNSTLAAETQSLSRGLSFFGDHGDGAGAPGRELQNVKAWRERLGGEELLVMGSEASEGFLKESLAVVDAKSLYDHLSPFCGLGSLD
ncbi:unnamed protein product, partial [Durusdinium trenchii]